MPEFHIVVDGPVAGVGYFELDAFTRGYIEALFFTENSPAFTSDEWFGEECQRALEEGTADGTLPGDCGFSDLSPEALGQIFAECEAFQTRCAVDLSQAYSETDYTPEQAGRDYWFTRNGHGVGFWDRDALNWFAASDNSKKLQDTLSDAARYSEVNPYYSEDGLIYLD